MSPKHQQHINRFALFIVPLVCLSVAVLAILGFHEPFFQQKLSGNESPATSAPALAAVEEQHSLALSDQALRNIGINSDTILPVKVSSFKKTLVFPAIVVDRPGRSKLAVPSTASGIVQRVYVEPGETVVSGQPLFDILLVHEELIRCQSDLLALLQKKDVVESERKRLEGLSADIAPKSIREIAFQKSEIDSQIASQKNALLVHGLSQEQIDETIIRDRKLVRMITVRLPKVSEDGIAQGPIVPIDVSQVSPQKTNSLQIESLEIEKGQQVEIGQSLCQIIDMSRLSICGRSFAHDENILNATARKPGIVTALFEGHDGFKENITGLSIRSIDNRIDSVNRTLNFYVELPNWIIKDDDAPSAKNPDDPSDPRFVNWRFKPGQRCELLLEYETVEDCIVLPSEAVAQEVNDAYVFQWNGTDDGKKVWHRKAVHVFFRARDSIAIANDGSILPGAVVAARGAGQLQIALTSGGGKLQSACPCGDH